MDLKLLIIQIIMIIYICIGIFDAIIVYIYLTSVNKTSYENDACILTIFISIINILNGICILCIFHFKNDSKYWNILKLGNFIIYIITITLCSTIKRYGIFIYAIILQLFIYTIITITVFLLLYLSFNNIINIKKSLKNKEVIVINIPQIAVIDDNIEKENIEIPRATIVKFNNGILL